MAEARDSMERVGEAMHADSQQAWIGQQNLVGVECCWITVVGSLHVAGKELANLGNGFEELYGNVACHLITPGLVRSAGDRCR